MIDSDKNGVDLEKTLISGLYKGEYAKNIISAKEITEMDGSELEDIIPYKLLNKAIDKYIRCDDIEFDDIYNDNEPIIPQVEKFASANNIELPDGWKVELAKSAKLQLLKSKTTIDEKYLKMWSGLFAKLIDDSNNS